MTATKVSRRNLLKGAVGVTAAAATLPLTSSRAWAAAGPSGPATLVVIFQRGACDSLSLIAPLNNNTYKNSRPRIGVPAGSALALNEAWGLHPRMAPLRPYFDTNGAAILGTGIVGLPMRSHFEAMDEMERGARDRSVGTGWLARYIQNNPPRDPNSPFRVVTASGAPTSVRGAPNPLSLVGANPLALPGGGFTTPILRPLFNPAVAPKQVNQAGTDAFAMMDETAALFSAPYEPGGGAVYPATGLGTQLKAAAQVIRSGLNPEIITVDHGSWDTHQNMGSVNSDGLMDRLIGDFASSIAAFLTDLAAGANGNVTVLTMTEFGRQMAENISGGLDHGEGSVMFTFGQGVNPGVHGHIDLDTLVGNAYLPQVDYRDMFNEVLNTRLGAPNTAMAPGYTPNPLNVFNSN